MQILSNTHPTTTACDHLSCDGLPALGHACCWGNAPLVALLLEHPDVGLEWANPYTYEGQPKKLTALGMCSECSYHPGIASGDWDECQRLILARINGTSEEGQVESVGQVESTQKEDTVTLT